MSNSRLDTSGEASRRRRDIRALTLFLLVLIALSLMFYIPLISARSLSAWGGWAVFLLMWAPGIAGVVAALAAFRSLRPLGLLGNRNMAAWSVVCLVFPVLYTLVIYQGLRALSLVDAEMNKVGISILAVAFLHSLMSAFGEELGWRGFASPLFSRLFGFKAGQFALGLIWYLYHLPPLLFTDYGSSPHPIFGNVMFLVSVVSLGFLLGLAREHSDSVWPSTFYHASHNLFFFALFAPVVPNGDLAGWLVGEQGAALAAVLFATAGVVLLLYRRVWTS